MTSASPSPGGVRPAAGEHDAPPESALRRGLGVVLASLNNLGTIWIMGLMLLVCADVVGRSGFNRPIDGVSEIAAFSVVGIVFLQAAATVHSGRMTQSTMMLDWVAQRSGRIRNLIEAGYMLIGAAMFALIVRATWPLLQRSIERQEFFGVPGLFTMPTWPIRLIMVIGSTAVVLVYLVKALDLVLARSYAHEMSEIEIGLALIAAMVFMVLMGLQVAIALYALSFAGIWVMRDNFELASKMLGIAAYSGIQEIVFSSIPLFVLMGMFVAYAGLGKDIFDVAAWLLRNIAGGLGIAVVAANAVFAAVTGISIASAAVFTRVAVPELLKHGYSPKLAVGTVAGSSILGMLIPPSVLFILFGILAEESIGKLFIAGLVPGILMAIAFSLGIVVMVTRFKGFAGRVDSASDLDHAETPRSAAQKFAPVGVLVVLMLGGLYSGVFTPTEAGAVGALGALLIALFKRRLNAATVWRVLHETGVISVSILILLSAASLYSQMLTYSGVPEAISEALKGAGGGVVGFWALYIAVVVGLGCILDSTSIMLIVVPICIPIARAFEIDMIQFGVVTVIAVEIGLLTPPLGMSAFTVQSTLQDRSIGLDQIFRGCMPFVLIMLAVLLLCAAFPSLSLVLVR